MRTYKVRSYALIILLQYVFLRVSVGLSDCCFLSYLVWLFIRSVNSYCLLICVLFVCLLGLGGGGKIARDRGGIEN